MASIRSAVGNVSFSRMPWHLFAGALALTAIGAAFVRSSGSWPTAMKHLVFAGIGCGVFFTVAAVDYRRWSSVAPLLYLAGLGALVGLFLFGHEVNNARRWFDLGPISVQPSEPMKYILVVSLAAAFRAARRKDRLRDLAVPLALTFVPMMLIVKEPDLGTTLLFVTAFFSMAYLAGVPVRNLAILLAAGIAVLGGALGARAWLGVGPLKDYHVERVRGFIDPSSNPNSPAVYNAEQAAIAITAGGLKGQGWGRGVLNRLGRVPERDRDFIFPVIAEEWGLVRTGPVILLYLLMMVFLAQIARNAVDPFGQLLAGGVLCFFAVQSLLHVAISLRLAPITGLTLPLVSYGGSSLVCTYGALGLAASVPMHEKGEFFVDYQAAV